MANSYSVIIPLYQGARHIGATLDSVCAQTRPIDELIVVDDGSTDDGVDICSQHPSRPRIVRQQNGGVAVARNHGTRIATGSHVAFLDQDDLWHESRLERIDRYLTGEPRCRVVMTAERAFSTKAEGADLAAADDLVANWAEARIAEGGEPNLVSGGWLDTSGSDAAELVDHTMLLRGPISVTTSFVAERSLVLDSGLFATWARAMDDYVLLVSMARLSPIHRIDQPTAFYRVHVGATSRSTRLAQPFLTAAVALRRGQVLVPRGLHRGERLPALDEQPLVAHLLQELGQDVSGEGIAGLGDILGICQLLGGSSADRRAMTRTAVRAWLRHRYPVFAKAVRTVKRRV